MREAEPTRIINRLSSEVDSNTVYSRQIELLIDLVNYGGGLIMRAYDSSKHEIDDVMIITVLLKHIVQMLDGVQVLISSGNAHASTLQVRSTFEAYLYMLWMMKGDSKRKARFYYVFELRKQRKWALKATSNTQERQKFMELYKDFAQTVNWNELAQLAKTNLSAIDLKLSRPTLKPINEMIETKNRLDWYKALDINNLRDLAKEVDEEPIYDLYYSKFSDVMHASSYRDQIRVKSGSIALEPIRTLDDALVVIVLSCHVATKGYRAILERYRKDELLNFAQKYITDWGEAVRNIRSVNYKFVGDNRPNK